MCETEQSCVSCLHDINDACFHTLITNHHATFGDSLTKSFMANEEENQIMRCISLSFDSVDCSQKTLL